MKQSAGWLLCHARVTVGRAGYNTFKKSEDATHFWDSIESSNDVNF
jgi:hypothetical protein